MFRRAKFGRNRSNHCRDMAIFPLFKMAVAAILNFEIFEILTIGTLTRAKLRHHAKFRRNRSNCSRDMAIFRFFQDSGCPPPWICCVSDWTTHEGRLVVFITVQKLVGIDGVVSIICEFNFGLKTPIHAPFWGVFGAQFPPPNVTHRPNPKKDRPLAERCHLSDKV